MWVYSDRDTLRGFLVFAHIEAELVITVTMAVSTRASLSGKLPTPSKIRDSDSGS